MKHSGLLPITIIIIFIAIVVLLMSGLLSTSNAGNTSQPTPKSCKKMGDICVDGPSTKVIEGFEVFRDCWEYKSTYECEGIANDSCSLLREGECFEVKSDCKETYKGSCILLEKDFHCQRFETYERVEEKAELRDRNGVSSKPNPCTDIQCLDGSCADKSYEANSEMLSSVAQLSIFKEMEGQLKGEFDTLFKGTDSRCTKAVLGYKDCCGSGKGWGISIKMGQCQSEEIATAQKNKAGLCHELGTYCAEKLLGACTRKKRSFCCFTSKLLKAVHEQGRSQLDIGWGSPKSPNCQGFTPEQLSEIDFSKLDLSEVYEDMLGKFKAPDLSRLSESISLEMKNIEHDAKSIGKENASYSTRGLNKKHKDGL
jgi:conjugal transfer mating pair stabilization protein TraN